MFHSTPDIPESYPSARLFTDEFGTESVALSPDDHDLYWLYIMRETYRMPSSTRRLVVDFPPMTRPTAGAAL